MSDRGIDPLTVALLRAHIKRAAEDISDSRQALFIAIVGELGQAKVENLDADFGLVQIRYHDVGRFEIAVDDAVFMSVLQAVAGLDKYVQSDRPAQFALLGNHLSQGFTLDQIHGVKRQATFVDTQVRYAHQINMTELGDISGFVLKAHPAQFVDLFRWHDFEGALLAETRMAD